MLFVGIVVFFVMRGVQFTLGLHMNTYFWQITPAQIGGVATLAVVGLVIGVPFWTRVSRGLDKKPTFLLGIVWFSLFAMAPPVLKLAGAWPDHADLRIYVGSLAGMGFLAAFGGAAALIAAGSMMADLTDEHELTTGRRQEGIFFGALTFAGQSASGLGHQIAGLGIDLISFPAQALPGEVAPTIVRNLGILYGPGIFGLAAISLAFMSRYRLTRERLHGIQAELSSRRAAAPEVSKVSEPVSAAARVPRG
jgi:Na+/melibiose symporter-like transporter